jgi:hypothetical protein
MMNSFNTVKKIYTNLSITKKENRIIINLTKNFLIFKNFGLIETFDALNNKNVDYYFNIIN